MQRLVQELWDLVTEALQVVEDALVAHYEDEVDDLVVDDKTREKMRQVDGSLMKQIWEARERVRILNSALVPPRDIVESLQAEVVIRLQDIELFFGKDHPSGVPEAIIDGVDATMALVNHFRPPTI